MTAARRRGAVAPAALFLAIAALTRVAGAADPTAQEHLARIAPAVVRVEVVMQLELSGGGQTMNQEIKGDAAGVVVDPSALVMIGDVGHVIRQLETQLPEGASIRLQPTKFEITFAGEAKPREAVLVARDMTLGLAFLQVLDLEGKVPAVDLSQGATPRLGQDLVGVRRLPRGFDDAPELLRLRVAQRIEQPRAMWGIQGDFDEHGLPAFDLSGAPVGVVAYQFGAEGLDMARGRSAMGGLRAFLLPLEPVRASLAQALKRVPDAVAKAKAGRAAAAEGAKETPSGKPAEPPKEKPPEAPGHGGEEPAPAK